MRFLPQKTHGTSTDPKSYRTPTCLFPNVRFDHAPERDPVYQLAFADPPLCPLPYPMPEELLQRMDMQQAIHEGVFNSSYDVCEDSALILDDEIMEVPWAVSGLSAQDEAFTLNVSFVERITDWETIGGLTQAQIDDLHETNSAGSIIIGDLAGPAGTRRIAAFTFSIDLDNLERASPLLPIYDLGAVPEMMTWCANDLEFSCAKTTRLPIATLVMHKQKITLALA